MGDELQIELNVRGKASSNLNEQEKVTRFLAIVDRAVHLYIEKNRRYGDSFTKQYKDFGNISACIRLNDKIERLKNLVKVPEDCGDEPIEDTLIDIVNYAIMTLMEIEKSKE